MRLIHCADLHLDSAMTRHLDEETQALRRRELLIEFERMVSYAMEHEVEAILICGDLFDTDVVSRVTAGVVRDIITNAPQISFYYLRGNHDTNSVLSREPVPQNLFLFSEEGRTYQKNGVCITGIEGGWKPISLPEEGCRIVMLHGVNGRDFSFEELKKNGIDYLALGHLHTYQMGTLWNHGVYCYPGCLAGRGFDECGEKGFVLLDVKGRQVKSQFVPFARRVVRECFVDVSDAYSTEEVARLVEEEIKHISASDMVRVVLCGCVDVLSERNLSYLTMRFKPCFFVFQVVDHTEYAVDYNALVNDKTMRGEFLRLVNEQEWTEERKRAVTEIGIKALMGDELLCE